jgi:RNA polymerase sigma factor (sigma-70 family)
MTEQTRRGRIRPLLSGLILRSQTDERLALLASAGNQQAFSAIYERYQRELGSHAHRIVRADRVDDVVQHAMLAAWTTLLGGAEISDLRAWLHRVVHNAALDTVTRRGYDDGDIPDSTIAPVRTDELAEGRLSAASALAAIAALPGSQRRALTLTAVEGRSGRDAAMEMGISESAMRQLVYRARSGVRAGLTAVVPLPLVTRLIAAGGAPPAAATVGLTAAGGGAATIAKVVAVVGVTAATLGATHALQGHPQPRHARKAATSQAATIIAERGATAALAARRASANQQSTPAGGGAAGQHGEQHQTGDHSGSSASRQNGSSAGGQNGTSQQGSGNSAVDQSGSQRPAGGTGDQQPATQQQPGTSRRTVTAPSGTNHGSESQQSSQANGIPSGESSVNLSPAAENGQSGNGN